MFKKILIANRGEIACRVIKTARAMGIETVAVYSDADATAPHVALADEAVHIGPAAAAESYLVIDKICAAATSSGAEAVHPGYGFLSERADFATALAKAGVTFLGPTAHAIRAMGDKIESKKLAAEAGVSTVPGSIGVIADADEAAKIASEIGYPVMIKASAGGGGKGMRIAYSADELKEGFDASMNEARNSFGDDRVFIEKFVEQPRHIEIQVLGDKHGNVLYLGERECSIQRRNQKVIEEAPSSFLDAKTRRRMGEQAVALSKAVGYDTAGTVEFIVDHQKNFYFLEMNTRLQVEHPVTELITGIDLVEKMIRVGFGEPLAMSQSDVKLNGWAIESRVYAEDPYRNFLPSTGRLTRYRPPEAVTHADGSSVRLDDGVVEGSEISRFYDPMIAKLITWAPNREAAATAQRQALDSFELEGVGHNLPFLAAVMDHPRFLSGAITTAFIAEEYPDGFTGVVLNKQEQKRLAQMAVAIAWREHQRCQTISGRLQPEPTPPPAQWRIALGDAQFDLEAMESASRDDGRLALNIGGEYVAIDWRPGATRAKAVIGDETIIVKVDPIAEGWRLRWRGADVDAKPRSIRAAELAARMPKKLPPDTSTMLLCPMPGLLVRLDVAAGDEVQEGQALAVVEAMKMENILRAEKKAVVKSVKAVPGDCLAVDAVIIEFG